MQAAQRKPETRRPYVDPRKPGKSRLPLSVPQARITDLTSTIEELTAVSSRLSTEIKNVEAEIAKNQEALDKATAMRQKELAEFNAEEKDMLQSIGATLMTGAGSKISKIGKI